MTSPPPLSPEALREITARCEKATPGSWRWMDGWETGTFGEDGDKYVSLQLMAGDKELLPLRVDHHKIIWDSYSDPNESTMPADRAFIAAARTDIPALLAHCAWLEKEIERLKAT